MNPQRVIPLSAYEPPLCMMTRRPLTWCNSLPSTVDIRLPVRIGIFVRLAASQRHARAAGAITPYSQVAYFSFVTMSTLGYGDIVPETPLAQTLTWMQSVMGQFYLAVLVAWIVSAVPRTGPLAGGSHSEQDKENHQ